MCDTLVATGSVTADGVVLFGKNSDREPNEALEVVVLPAADHTPGGTVHCTYLDVPQVTHTHAVLLAKPFWIWGAEMGTNDQGVTIGNEAVFTKVPYGTEDGLIGMDLLRLALERAATAEEAVTVITSLLGEHGQSGNCGFQHKLFYHNSFLIADPQDAWVLESAGPHWAALHVEGVYTISNRLTITNAWDLASPDLVPFAVDQKWCKGPEDFSFARCYSDFIYSTFSDAANRRKRTMALLEAARGQVTAGLMMRTLRDHGPSSGALRPDRAWSGPRSARTRRSARRAARRRRARWSRICDPATHTLRDGHRRALHQPLQAGLARRAVAAHRPTPNWHLRPDGALLAARGPAPARAARSGTALPLFVDARDGIEAEWGEERCGLRLLVWQGAQLSGGVLRARAGCRDGVAQSGGRSRPARPAHAIGKARLAGLESPRRHLCSAPFSLCFVLPSLTVGRMRLSKDACGLC